MPKHIFIVKDTFSVEGRGVVAVGDWHSGEAAPGTPIARVGDAIQLRAPSGRTLNSKIEAITIPHREILLSPHIQFGRR